MTQSVSSTDTYTFTYKRRFWPFKLKVRNACFHHYNAQTDKMWIQLREGGTEIVAWRNCTLSLGQDWVDAMVAQGLMEREQTTRSTFIPHSV